MATRRGGRDVLVLTLVAALGACASPAERTERPQRTESSPSTTTRSASSSPTARSTPTTRARPTDSPAHTYAFPISGCRADYGRAHHGYPATDIFSERGCDVVSPVDGRIDERGLVDRWSPRKNDGATRGGLFVSVVGEDGVRYYGSHLDSVARATAPGTAVRAGDRLGSVGDTGSARGVQPHLHFGVSWPTRAGVWWVRRGAVSPWRYLQAWQRGRDLSPAAAVEDARARAGSAVPPCRAEC